MCTEDSFRARRRCCQCLRYKSFHFCFLGSLLTRNRSKLFVLQYQLLEKLVRMKNENIWCVCNTSYNVDEGKCYRWYSLSLWMSFATSPLFDMCNCISGGNEKLLVPQSPFWLDLRSHSDSRPYSHGSALFSSDCIIYIYEAICTEVNACMQAHDWFSGERFILKNLHQIKVQYAQYVVFFLEIPMRYKAIGC